MWQRCVLKTLQRFNLMVWILFCLFVTLNEFLVTVLAAEWSLIGVDFFMHFQITQCLEYFVTV